MQPWDFILNTFSFLFPSKYHSSSKQFLVNFTVYEAVNCLVHAATSMVLCIWMNNPQTECTKQHTPEPLPSSVLSLLQRFFTSLPQIHLSHISILIKWVRKLLQYGPHKFMGKNSSLGFSLDSTYLSPPSMQKKKKNNVQITKTWHLGTKALQASQMLNRINRKKSSLAPNWNRDEYMSSSLLLFASKLGP